MLRLILDVTDYGDAPGFADAECTVPALPGELALLASVPCIARSWFSRSACSAATAKVGRQARQQMNMIGCSSDRDGNGIQFAEDSAEIGMNVGSYCVSKERRTTGRGKNDVDEEAGVGVGHSYAPPGLRNQV